MKTRIFRSCARFKDGTDHLRATPVGDGWKVEIVTKRGAFESAAYSILDCEDLVRRGNWYEETGESVIRATIKGVPYALSKQEARDLCLQLITALKDEALSNSKTEELIAAQIVQGKSERNLGISGVQPLMPNGIL